MVGILSLLNRDSLDTKDTATLLLLASARSRVTAAENDPAAVKISYQEGDFSKRGNLRTGETDTTETSKGTIKCTGGGGFEYTGKKGPQGNPVGQEIPRRCMFVP